MNIQDTFDSRFSSKELQKLKVILCYMDSPFTNPLSIYIKICEAQNAFSYASAPSSSGASNPRENINFQEFLSDLTPYCSLEEQNMLENINNSLKQWENMQELMEQYQVLSEYMQSAEMSESEDPSTKPPDIEQLMQLMNLFQAKDSD